MATLIIIIMACSEYSNQPRHQPSPINIRAFAMWLRTHDFYAASGDRSMWAYFQSGRSSCLQVHRFFALG